MPNGERQDGSDDMINTFEYGQLMRVRSMGNVSNKKQHNSKEN